MQFIELLGRCLKYFFGRKPVSEARLRSGATPLKTTPVVVQSIGIALAAMELIAKNQEHLCGFDGFWAHVAIQNENFQSSLFHTAINSFMR